MMKFQWIVLLAIMLLIVGCKGEKKGTVEIENTYRPTSITTFKSTGDPICMQDGKPIVRLFSTSWCPHCAWIKETVDAVMQEYVEKGSIVAYHWEIDIKDDLLTKENEGFVPEEEMSVFTRYNPEGSIPTFVFGCKYMRVGNGYESQSNLGAEEQEFRLVIEDLLAQEQHENQ